MTQIDTVPSKAFIHRLEALDPGDRARLKRCAGVGLNEARGVTGLFFRLLPAGVSPEQEAAYFMIATLYPLAQEGEKGDFGMSLHRTRTKDNAPGLDRRVQALLDADLAQLPFRLRQAVHFIQSNRRKINWSRLLDDLLAWNHPDKIVQQRWARSYYSSDNQ